MTVVITLSVDKQRLIYLNGWQFVPGRLTVIIYMNILLICGEGDISLIVKYSGEKAIDDGV